MNEYVETELVKDGDKAVAVEAKKRDVMLARSYVILDDEELDRIKRAIRGSIYGSVMCYAEQVLHIHKKSLSRKLNGERRFQYHEILLIEETLDIEVKCDRF